MRVVDDGPATAIRQNTGVRRRAGRATTALEVRVVRHSADVGNGRAARAACTVMCVGLLCASGGAQAPVDPSSFSFDIIPGERFGPIRENTSRRVLVSLAPVGAFRDGDISIGEGFCTDGVLVFPDTPDEIEVAWQDAPQSRVAFVRASRPGGRWRTSRGVGVGTLLTELERLAGGTLTFSGFGWDYGGGTTWTESGGEIGLRLDIDPADASKTSGPDAADIFGDRLVRSDHPVIRTVRVRVDELIQSWGQHAAERDCR